MVAETSSQALKQRVSPLPPPTTLLFYRHFSAKVLKRPFSYVVTKQPLSPQRVSRSSFPLSFFRGATPACIKSPSVQAPFSLRFD
jgi:hypothetical protein